MPNLLFHFWFFSYSYLLGSVIGCIAASCETFAAASEARIIADAHLLLKGLRLQTHALLTCCTARITCSTAIAAAVALKERESAYLVETAESGSIQSVCQSVRATNDPSRRFIYIFGIMVGPVRAREDKETMGVASRNSIRRSLPFRVRLQSLFEFHRQMFVFQVECSLDGTW